MSRLPLAGTIVVAAALAALAGCVESLPEQDAGPDVDVAVANNTGQPVEVRFRAAYAADGSEFADFTKTIPPGATATLGSFDGPAGNYVLSAQAGSIQAEAGQDLRQASGDCLVDVHASTITITCATAK